MSSSENRYPVNSSSVNHGLPGTAPTSQPIALSTEREKQDSISEPVAGVSVKTRMQKLAEQRRGWDSGMCLTHYI